MKKYAVMVMAVMLMGVMASGSWANYYNEGHFGETEADAYIIDSVADIVELRDRVNNGSEAEGLYYRQTLDLNLEQYTEWVPIGAYGPFTGHFDGGGHTVKVKMTDLRRDDVDVYLENGVIDYVPTPFTTYGLFGAVETKSDYAIKNLNVSGIVGETVGGYTMPHCAGIATELRSASIENCSFTGKIEANGVRDNMYAGGIVENMLSGTIKNCTVKNATVKVNPYQDYGYFGYVGGIVSRMAGGTIEGCTVDENTIISGISQSGSYPSLPAGQTSAGEIVGFLNKEEGYFNRGSVKNNTCYAQIEAKNDTNENLDISVRCGGIIGEVGDTNVSIEDNTYIGDISGTSVHPYVGGIIGKFSGSTIPTISNNRYSGAAYGIGYDLGGNATDEPGCIKITGGNNGTGDNTGGNNGNTGTNGNTGGNTNGNTGGNTGNNTGGNTNNNGQTGNNTNGNTGNNTGGNTGNNTNNNAPTDNDNGTPEAVSGSGGGGGGCNSGLAILALALTALITLRKSRS